jgi:hypothetical protein
MTTKYTANDVARMFNAPIECVRAAYAKNAKQLRQSAVKAGTGKYRGFTAAWYVKAATHAEAQL